MVTNQTGIARGYFSEETLHATNARMQEQLRTAGARLDGVYVCMHHPRAGEPPYRADCDCRKPRPGLLHRAAAELGLDLPGSVMIGDKLSDVTVGHAVGAAGVLVLTGYGRGEWEYQRDDRSRGRSAGRDVKPDHVAEDLLDAVEWALARAATAAGA
jgi:D-glycero-D-manno-heptose 1,7-bisphosphate phosphatase